MSKFIAHNQKITPEIEMEICVLFVKGLTITKIAEKFNIAPSTVYTYIVKNKIKYRNRYGENCHFWKGGEEAKKERLNIQKENGTYFLKTELKKTYLKNWRQNNKTYFKEDYIKNKDIRKQKVKQYQKTENGKLIQLKSHAKRRKYSFNPLNKYFKNSNAHHINDTYIIFIPKELHVQYYGHRLDRPESMVQINIEAFKFMNPNVYTHLIETYTMKF